MCKIRIYFILSLLFLLNFKLKAQDENRLTYDLPLEYLMEIEIVEDTNSESYLEPTYDLTIEDLMKLEIVKKLEVDQYIDINYNVPIEDLMKIKIPADKKDLGVEPTYEMSMEGLLELEVKEDYKIVDRIDITYDISIDGLMKISILRK